MLIAKLVYETLSCSEAGRLSEFIGKAVFNDGDGGPNGDQYDPDEEAYEWDLWSGFA